jgi:2'-5' RNA ligase
VFSLNVPVPGRVRRVAADLHPRLSSFEQVRDEHTLVAKRLGEPDPAEYPAIEGRIRRSLAGTDPFDAAVDGVGVFEDPPAGPGPVVYLAVDSPGLVAVHERLCEAVAPVDGMEGDGYVPHVTLARGGSLAAARSLAEGGADVERVEWTVDALAFYHRDGGGGAGRVRLPA